MKQIFASLALITIVSYTTAGIRIKKDIIKTRTVTYEEQQFFRKLDTLKQVVSLTGKSLLRDEAEMYIGYAESVINGISRDSRLDSTKIK